MANKLLILGAGQYGRVVLEIAESMGTFEDIAFIDDNFKTGDCACDLNVIGSMAELEALSRDFDCAIPAIGNGEVRLALLERLNKSAFDVPNLISPLAYVAPSARIGHGVVVEPLAGVNSNVVIGDGTFISMGAVVNHDSIIGECCHIDCNSTVAARSVIEPKTKITR